MRVTLHVQPLLVNVFLAPAAGLALVYGQPRMVVARDIAGVPLIAYAFMATLVPVIVLTAFSNRLCTLFEQRGYSLWVWYGAGLIVGAVAGALAGWVLAGMGIQGGTSRVLVAGGLTGAICALAQVLLWRKGRHAANPAAA